jgi:hypothetical protein
MVAFRSAKDDYVTRFTDSGAYRADNSTRRMLTPPAEEFTSSCLLNMKLENERWDTCPPGILGRMVGEVRESRQQAVRRRVTSVLAVLLLAGASTWLTVQVAGLARSRNGDSELPEMTCGEVQQLLHRYGHGVLAESLEAKIATHLNRCEHCRNLHRKLSPGPAGHKQTSHAANNHPHGSR